MKKCAMLFLLVVLIVPAAFAQQSMVFGKVLDANKRPVMGAEVFFENTSIATTTNNRGEYKIERLNPGRYTVVAFAFGLETQSQKISIDNDSKELNFMLRIMSDALEELEIAEAKANTFGVARLNAVEGTAIYEGKKSEVVIMGDLNANLATNNSRQVFSKVAGLNIWESDGAGLQLGVGGRGLSPNRTSNFNTRQNGYDISADPMGYPDAYYSPPMQALDRIEVVRGAASLQYGPQFGGLVNFVLKKGPKDKKFAFETTNTVGSYGFVNTYNSVGGTVGKVNYYGYYQFRRGNGWRENSDFDTHAAYGAVTYQINDKLSITGEYSKLHYLTQQAGGLTDAAFAEDPRQSNRARNWFLIDWNLGTVVIDYNFNPRTQLNIRTFGMSSGRDAIGNLGRIDRADDGAERMLLVDDYLNVGSEARLIHRYELASKAAVFLVGARFFNGTTDRSQGLGSAASDADFNYIGDKGNDDIAFDLRSRNWSAFAENIFDINDRLSITPGIRFEYIHTNAVGSFRDILRDLAGNIIYEEEIPVDRERARSKLMFGVGVSYKPNDWIETYANISQNYRPINFNDVAISIPSLQVDPNIQDESGFNADIGIRGQFNGVLSVDASVFVLQYKDRIGEVLEVEDGNVFRYRTNISDSRNMGIETFAELDIWKLAYGENTKTKLSVFSNATLIDARYIGSQEEAFKGKKVEYVPNFIFRTGLAYARGGFQATYQYSFTSSQYADATNAESRPEAVVGLIPSYSIMDLNLSYEYKRFKVQAGLNNLLNNSYFTRRATGYPGPGIIPSDGRTFYLTVGAKFD